MRNGIPFVSEVPTIIFGADVTHPPPGEDSASSIAAVSLFPIAYSFSILYGLCDLIFEIELSSWTFLLVYISTQVYSFGVILSN